MKKIVSEFIFDVYLRSSTYFKTLVDNVKQLNNNVEMLTKVVSDISQAQISLAKSMKTIVEMTLAHEDELTQIYDVMSSPVQHNSGSQQQQQSERKTWATTFPAITNNKNGNKPN